MNRYNNTFTQQKGSFKSNNIQVIKQYQNNATDLSRTDDAETKKAEESNSLTNTQGTPCPENTAGSKTKPYLEKMAITRSVLDPVLTNNKAHSVN